MGAALGPVAPHSRKCNNGTGIEPGMNPVFLSPGLRTSRIRVPAGCDTAADKSAAWARWSEVVHAGMGFRAENDGRPMQGREFDVAGNEIRMDMGFQHVLQPVAFVFEQLVVRIGIPLGIDDRRLLGIPIGDQIGPVRKAFEVEPLQIMIFLPVGIPGRGSPGKRKS